MAYADMVDLMSLQSTILCMALQPSPTIHGNHTGTAQICRAHTCMRARAWQDENLDDMKLRVSTVLDGIKRVMPATMHVVMPMAVRMNFHMHARTYGRMQVCTCACTY